MSFLTPMLKVHIALKMTSLSDTGKNGTELTELKWRMLKKAEMEDQPYSRLDISKSQNVLILLPNK